MVGPCGTVCVQATWPIFGCSDVTHYVIFILCDFYVPVMYMSASGDWGGG